MVPQFNLLGHGSASRTATGKHVFLYRNPELQSLMEQDGWSWCLSNPHTRELLTEAVLELHDFYGSPPYFHIGCDEAYNMGSCASCRRADLATLMRDHIMYFRDLFAKQGVRVMMWHDMLLSMADKRFEGYIVVGAPIDKLDNLYKELAQDIIICDWQYGYPSRADNSEPTWPTCKFFKNAGFDVIVCPWLEARGTGSLGELAAREKLFGLLSTTWHHVSGHDMQNIYLNGANASWGGCKTPQPWNDIHSSCNYHIRQVSYDMNAISYEMSGANTIYQIDKNGIPR